jgi:hypothetical protein
VADLVTHEKLGTVRIDGVFHAVYPTAERTLCLLERPDAGKLPDLWGLTPTCFECLLVTDAWNHIDHAAPVYWWHEVEHEELLCDPCSRTRSRGE